MLINHPEAFKEGVRVFLVAQRPKDGAKSTKRRRYVSTCPEEFDELLIKIEGSEPEGTRIYASAEPRDVKKTIREFKQKQLDNDYNNDVEDFYLHIESRWKTALMQTQCSVKSEKLWLIDCDTDEEVELTRRQLKANYDRDFLYEYDTKNGRHIIVQPFNSGKCTDDFRKLIKKNPMMLWGY